VDRYRIGERQTSACAAPTEWLDRMGLGAAVRQTFDSIVVHTPRVRARWPLPWTFSTFDYRELCRLLWAQADAEFETAKVDRRTGSTVHTDRGDLSAPLIVDALGWRRILGPGDNFQPPDAPLSRGLEVHPAGSATDLELWIDPSYVSPGYSWSFPARDEVRVGVGSFDSRVTVKDPAVRLLSDVGREPNEWQGNWIPHRLRPAVADGVFFAGDSAGHCLPLTAEGIRTALHFGIACGREIRDVVEGRQDRAAALRRYGAFSASHARAFTMLYGAQQAVRQLHGPAMDALVRLYARPRLTDWTFRRYLDIAPPSFATPPRGRRSVDDVEVAA
jgi:flavin-dependent dehydrogenase